MTGFVDSILGPVIIVLVDIVAFILVGKLGKRSTGRGPKYEPFSGGEPNIPPRGLYRSSLFVFAALFLVVETFALLLSGSFMASGSYYPILFLLGGGSVMTVTVVWYLEAGGGRF